MKILVVLSRVPYPLEKGDKLRAYNHIKHLSKKHEVVLFALYNKEVHPSAEEELKKYCSSMYFFRLRPLSIVWNVIKAFFKGIPIQCGYFYQCKAKRLLDKVVKEEQIERIFCQLVRMTEYVKKYPQKKTLDYQDVLSMGMQRRMEKSLGVPRIFYRMEWKRLRRYERKIFPKFDQKTIISKPDQVLIDHTEKEQIQIIPNGVDTAFFHPMEKEKKYDIVFTGNMGYAPNVHAACYLVDVVLPIVRKSRNDLRVLIAGSNPSRRVRSLANESITVSGWVEDIRDAYASSRVFIAPMRIGTGLQNKLLEAMAMRLPCITSPLANDALQAKEKEQILIGRSAEDYSWHINMLLDDEKTYERIAENGYQYVLQHYDWDKLSAQMEAIIVQ